MIIGFTGKKLCGKTEASKCLKGLSDITTLNFKSALIDELINGFPDLLQELDKHYYDGNSIHKLFLNKPPMMRKLMQNYGTDVRRNDDKEYWTKRWIEGAKQSGLNVVADDVRFLNEAKAVRDMGGVIVRIERPGLVSEDGHISETEMEQIEADYTIINDGTIEDLCKKIYEFCKV